MYNYIVLISDRFLPAITNVYCTFTHVQKQFS